MTDFSIERFIVEARAAAAGPDAGRATLSLMRRTLSDPLAVRLGMPEHEEDDVVLHEDDQVSIWYVRFRLGTEVPPHDHQVSTYIGVYDGAEENGLYRRTSTALERVKTKLLGPGEVLSLGPEGIHSVAARGAGPSQAIHVYLGPLTRVERSVFEWDTGRALPFTDENFERLVRSTG